MKKALLIIIALSFVSTGCKSIKGAMEKEAASRKMPAQLQGDWEHKGYLSYKLSIQKEDFTLEVFDRKGKRLRKFIGFIKIVDNRKNYIAAHLSQLYQGGKNLTGTLRGKYYKVFYYKELTDSSVKIFMVNGMTAQKYLKSQDENAKLDRKYNKFTK